MRKYKFIGTCPKQLYFLNKYTLNMIKNLIIQHAIETLAYFCNINSLLYYVIFGLFIEISMNNNFNFFRLSYIYN